MIIVYLDIRSRNEKMGTYMYDMKIILLDIIYLVNLLYWKDDLLRASDEKWKYSWVFRTYLIHVIIRNYLLFAILLVGHVWKN